MIPESFSVDQLAAAWEINRATVLQMIRDNRLHAVRVGRSYRIPAESVTAFLHSTREPEKPAHSSVAGVSAATRKRFAKRAS